MLRFEKACQVPNQQLAKQAIIEVHLSSVPRALLLTAAGLRDVLFAELCFLVGVIRVSVAPALRPGRWPADPHWLSIVTGESRQGSPLERALTVSS